MAKKKSKKKKDSKKKDSKKKDSKKKDSKKKNSKKKNPKKKKPKKKKPVAPKDPVIKNEDHSSNYNVIEAVRKLRSLKSKADLILFTKGETRLTVTKAIPAVMNRL